MLIIAENAFSERVWIVTVKSNLVECGLRCKLTLTFFFTKSIKSILRWPSLFYKDSVHYVKLHHEFRISNASFTFEITAVSTAVNSDSISSESEVDFGLNMNLESESPENGLFRVQGNVISS